MDGASECRKKVSTKLCCRTCHLKPHFCFQVMFRKTGYIYGKVYITGWHFMDFPMPQLGDYELMVRGRYEGGDGPVRKIRIQGRCFRKSISSVVCTVLVVRLRCFLLLR